MAMRQEDLARDDARESRLLGSAQTQTDLAQKRFGLEEKRFEQDKEARAQKVLASQQRENEIRSGLFDVLQMQNPGMPPDQVSAMADSIRSQGFESAEEYLEFQADAAEDEARQTRASAEELRKSKQLAMAEKGIQLREEAALRDAERLGLEKSRESRAKTKSDMPDEKSVPLETIKTVGAMFDRTINENPEILQAVRSAQAGSVGAGQDSAATEAVSRLGQNANFKRFFEAATRGKTRGQKNALLAQLISSYSEE